MPSRTLYLDAYASLTHATDDELIVYVRNDTPFASVEAAGSSILESARALTRFKRFEQRRCLVDLRNGPLRSDPAFEKIMSEVQPQFFAAIARGAVLVRTAVGKLQMTRIANVQKLTYAVFDDELKARQWLTQAPWPIA
ncbi:MAG: hypothetical protein Q8Q09_09975 [Deltaproteobacteria bacterium]|nr:hypothetical protein [Deltaproteobacteria bacterium]